MRRVTMRAMPEFTCKRWKIFYRGVPVQDVYYRTKRSIHFRIGIDGELRTFRIDKETRRIWELTDYLNAKRV